MKKLFRTSRRSAAVFALGSTALLGITAFFALQSSSASSKSPLDAPHQAAKALDDFVQPRFQDDRAGVFGLTRIITPDQLAGVNGHQGLGLIKAKTPTETTLLSQVADTHRDYLIAFLHCAHMPGHFKGDTSEIAVREFKPYLTVLATRPPGQYAGPAAPVKQVQQAQQEKRPSDIGLIYRQVDPDTTEHISTAALNALPKVKQGKSEEKIVGEWLVSMRPVKAEHESCLGCHVGAKKNDTLGMMVYAVKQSADPIKS